eukprot:1139454-Pelagomonas_calceolata.AAC.7
MRPRAGHWPPKRTSTASKPQDVSGTHAASSSTAPCARICVRACVCAFAYLCMCAYMHLCVPKESPANLSYKLGCSLANIFPASEVSETAGIERMMAGPWAVTNMLHACTDQKDALHTHVTHMDWVSRAHMQIRKVRCTLTFRTWAGSLELMDVTDN